MRNYIWDIFKCDKIKYMKIPLVGSKLSIVYSNCTLPKWQLSFSPIFTIIIIIITCCFLRFLSLLNKPTVMNAIEKGFPISATHINELTRCPFAILHLND